jgi:putative hydrolase of the HAD superfamily
MLRAIVFDLFETLITESGAPPASVSSLAPVLGCERESFRREWKALRPSVVIGGLAFRDALGDIAARLGQRADDATLQQVCDARIHLKAEPFGQIEGGIIAMLNQLRRRGLRLAVISNCFAEDVTAWPRCDLVSRIDVALFSFEAGLAKPDPEIYRQAVRRLDVAPSDAWFIGDGADDELSGAARAGLRAWRATWFLKRWPHFQEPAGPLTSVDEVVRLVDVEDR